jgi:hypothetical protein
MYRSERVIKRYKDPPRKRLRKQDYHEVEIRNAYISHRYRAALRGIKWDITLEEWCDVWLTSGKWLERGVGADRYCMHRRFDIGPYAKDNVEIVTNSENGRLKVKMP